MKRNPNRVYITQAVSASRIVLGGFFLYMFLNNRIIEAFCLFLFACFTDILDGVLARKFDITSSSGAYFDAASDFFFIFTAFLAFIIKDIYPSWVIILFIFMFLQFLATSKPKQPIYDPIGRYYGVFLFVIIGITVLFPVLTVYYALFIIMIGFTSAALLSRYVSLYISSKKPKSS